MDKQITTILNTKNQEAAQDSGSSTQDNQANKILRKTSAILPVNTRTIGAPEGIYILYLEDYVHTFMKKILAENRSKSASLEDVLERTQPDIALYGRCIEEHGRYRIVVSGAALLREQSDTDKIKQYNNTYFPSCTYIGTASVNLNKDSGLRLELTLHNTKVILDDFYIYYDQNEEMQNYLVEWNKAPVSPTEHAGNVRKNIDDAARLGRIVQAYNHEEAKVSFMWNVMNVLCLGFVICVMAYGIISVNNYNKMRSMQASIDYCMNFIAENTSFDISGIMTNEAETVPTIQQKMQYENEKAGSVKADRETMQAADETQENTEIDENRSDIETQSFIAEQQETEAVNQPAETDVSQALAEQQVQDSSQTAIPQYYVVQRGDTLRTICFDIYGDYSRVDEICKWNNIEDPDNILYGQKLLLP